MHKNISFWCSFCIVLPLCWCLQFCETFYYSTGASFLNVVDCSLEFLFCIAPKSLFIKGTRSKPDLYKKRWLTDADKSTSQNTKGKRILKELKLQIGSWFRKHHPTEMHLLTTRFSVMLLLNKKSCWNIESESESRTIITMMVILV